MEFSLRFLSPRELKPFSRLFLQVPLQAVWIFCLPRALRQIGQLRCWRTTDETVTSSFTSMDGRRPISLNWWCRRTSLNNSPSPHGWSTPQVLDWEARRRRCYVTRTRRVRVNRSPKNQLISPLGSVSIQEISNSSNLPVPITLHFYFS